VTRSISIAFSQPLFERQVGQPAYLNLSVDTMVPTGTATESGR
jgi:hypothetical protein